ncbi:protein DEHYDRATION-INDUCED 19-like isoform X2 [Salvia miltiorrhiza]|uniref:protein DEHYDRATION-INDUCED 19-like isoform X2 n=1 Tax=Salvia miltiorrhiza TaxID=226208 RepID=UPI0025AC0F97|nr:protein DEHYDRATION-INDUCED 19-like isoform X2 [Salvia miltiorrhiza]
MDSDFWTMRLAAAKRQFNNHHSQLDFDGEEEARPDYLCPYCYEELDIASLCSHLEAEHSYESKSAVCPVCSVKVAGDMISHLTLQHGHLFKMQRRGRLRKVPFPNSQALSQLGRDLREAHLQVLLGGSGFRSTSAASSTAVNDNLLCSLVLNFPTSENDDISKSLMSSLEENSAKNVAPQHMWKSSFQSCLSSEEREQRMSQAAGRAVFVQDLLASTLLADH